MIELRPYQQACIDALYSYFAEKPDGSPLIVAPTGCGKSVILGAFVQGVLKAWPSQRIAVVTHVKELIEQNAAKLLELWPAAPIGIYSAGLKRKDARYPITFGGIQSMANKSELFGRIDLMIVDESHLVPQRAEGQYRQLIAAWREINPRMPVIGFTATPYRLKGGMLTSGKDRIFTDVAYEVPVSSLIADGYLANVVTKRGDAVIDTSDVKTSAGEFVQRDLEAVARVPELVRDACTEIVAHGTDRRAWLVFCCGVDHARDVLSELRETHGVAAALVTGETPAAERAEQLRDYKAGRLRALVNVNVLTTGFDAPETDLVAILRATKSTGLYVQIIGRGMRIAPGKEDALVLDFGGNVERHGPIDRIEPKGGGNGGGSGESLVKDCPMCEALIWPGARVCPHCGHEFWPEGQAAPGHDGTATDLPILSGQIVPATPERWRVANVTYDRHEKEGKPDSLRVTYWCWGKFRCSEWVCFEHEGYARIKAEQWWMVRSNEGLEWVPRDVEEALEVCEHLPKPAAIHVMKDGQFHRIVEFEWTEQEERDGGDGREPEEHKAASDYGFDFGDIPF